MFDASGPKQQDFQFRLFIACDLSEISKARALMQEIGETTQLSEARIFDLQVAVSEAIANAIEHASSEVELDAWVFHDRLMVEITNEGEFQPGLYKDDERRRRGLGLPLMVSLADQLHVSRLPSGKTLVSLAFFLENYRHQMLGSETGEGVEASRPLEGSETDPRAPGHETNPQEVVDRYWTLAEFSPDAILVDANGKHVFANPAAAELLGARLPSELLGRDVARDIHPEDREIVAQRMGQLLAGGMVPPQEIRLLRLDGTPVSVEATASRVEFDGKPAVQAHLRDVTERKQTEEALRDSEQRFHTLFDSLIEGFCTIEMIFDEADNPVDYCFLQINQAFEGLTGLHEAQGKRMRELAPDHDAHWFEIYGRVASTGEPARFQAPATALGRYYDVSAYRIGGPESRRVGILFNDITDQKQVEEALRESEERFRTMADAIPQLAWVAKPDGYIYWYNRRWYEYTGTTPAEMEGWGWQSVHDPQALPGVLARWEQCIATGEPFDMEFPLRGADGEFRMFLTRAVPQKDAQGGVLQWFGTNTDISERQRAQAELERLLAKEQESAEELAAANEEIQAQYEETAAQSEELEAQSEELAAQNEEILVARDELVVLYEHERENARLKDALAEVDQTLVSSLERAEILDRALENGARALGAERAVLEIREPDGWKVRSVYRLPVELVGKLLSCGEASIATAMEKSGGVLVIEDADEDPRVNASTVARYGTTAALVLPISYQNRTMGSLQFLYASGPHRFSDAEIDFARNLTVSVALALENARLFEQQRSIAAALQQTILEMPSGVPHMLFSHLYRSATEETVVGGDFYDAFELEDGSIALLIGDVSGHGVNAARIATMVKASLVAFAHSYNDPNNVLTLVNQLLLRKAVSGFTSLMFAVFDPETGTLTYCSAGHPELLLARSGQVTSLASPRATPLGVFFDWSCASESIQLELGDTLLFYTDGVTEARREGELFGEERLVTAFRGKVSLPLEQLPQALLDEVLAFTGGRLQDDVAILAVRPLISISRERN